MADTGSMKLLVAGVLAIFSFGVGVQLLADDGSTPEGFYPPVPREEEGMSPELAAFADAVDRACGETYNVARQNEVGVEVTAAAEGWDERRYRGASLEVWADSQAELVRRIDALGEPPDRREVFSAWRENVATRARLIARRARAVYRGDEPAVALLSDRIARLKYEANGLGIEFGLRICTSNGPRPE